MAPATTVVTGTTERDVTTSTGRSPTTAPTTSVPAAAEPTTAPTTSEPAAGEPEPADDADDGVVVSIVDFAFDDRDLEIPVGTTVRWVNDDSFAHSVVADDDSFVSEVMDPGEMFEFAFEAAGQFDYHCGVHPSMTGTVTVVG